MRQESTLLHDLALSVDVWSLELQVHADRQVIDEEAVGDGEVLLAVTLFGALRRLVLVKFLG